MPLFNNEQIWLHRNGVEVNCNNDGDNRYSAILHQRIKASGHVTKLRPIDIVRGHKTAQQAIQALCDRNGILSYQEILSLKALAKKQYTPDIQEDD